MGNFRTTAAEKSEWAPLHSVGYLLEIFFLFGWIRKILDVGHFHLFTKN